MRILRQATTAVALLAASVLATKTVRAETFQCSGEELTCDNEYGDFKHLGNCTQPEPPFPIYSCDFVCFFSGHPDWTWGGQCYTTF